VENAPETAIRRRDIVNVPLPPPKVYVNKHRARHIMTLYFRRRPYYIRTVRYVHNDGSARAPSGTQIIVIIRRRTKPWNIIRGTFPSPCKIHKPYKVRPEARLFIIHVYVVRRPHTLSSFLSVRCSVERTLFSFRSRTRSLNISYDRILFRRRLRVVRPSNVTGRVRLPGRAPFLCPTYARTYMFVVWW